MKFVSSDCDEIFYPPKFDNKIHDYAKWKKKFNIWMSVTDAPVRKHGGLLIFQLDSKTQDSILDTIGISDITSDSGVQKILNHLDSLYEDDLFDLAVKGYDAHVHFHNYQRLENLSIDDYCWQFHKRLLKVQSFGTTIADSVLGYKLLKCANLTLKEEQLVKATTDQISYKSVAKQLKKIFRYTTQMSPSDNLPYRDTLLYHCADNRDDSRNNICIISSNEEVLECISKSDTYEDSTLYSSNIVDNSPRVLLSLTNKSVHLETNAITDAESQQSKGHYEIYRKGKQHVPCETTTYSDVFIVDKEDEHCVKVSSEGLFVPQHTKIDNDVKEKHARNKALVERKIYIEKSKTSVRSNPCKKKEKKRFRYRKLKLYSQKHQNGRKVKLRREKGLSDLKMQCHQVRTSIRSKPWKKKRREKKKSVRYRERRFAYQKHRSGRKVKQSLKKGLCELKMQCHQVKASVRSKPWKKKRRENGSSELKMQCQQTSS